MRGRRESNIEKHDMAVRDGKLLKYEGNEKRPVIPAGVTEISEGAFAGCSGIETILIPENVRVIGEGAFAGCTGLKKVYLTSAAEIREQAFKDCVSLAMLYVPYNAVFRKDTFENCTGLRRFYRWDKVYVTAARNGNTGFSRIGYEELPYLLSEVLPDCRFIRCNDLLKQGNEEYLEEMIRFTEERERIYRRLYGDRIRCYSGFDDYDPELSKGKHVTVIGCGTSGSRFLQHLYPYVELDDRIYCVTVDTAVTCPDFRGFCQHIGLYEDSKNCRCDGLGSGGYPEIAVPDVITYLHKYLPVIRNSRRIYLAGGAGGPTVNVLAQMIAAAASYYWVPVTAFLTLPCYAEGKKRQRIAEDTIAGLKRYLKEEDIVLEDEYILEDDPEKIGPWWEKKKENLVRLIIEELDQDLYTEKEAVHDQKG